MRSQTARLCSVRVLSLVGKLLNENILLEAVALSKKGRERAWHGESRSPLYLGLRSGPEGSSTGISLDHPEAATHLLRVTQPGAFDLGFQCVAQVSFCA